MGLEHAADTYDLMAQQQSTPAVLACGIYSADKRPLPCVGVRQLSRAGQPDRAITSSRTRPQLKIASGVSRRSPAMTAPRADASPVSSAALARRRGRGPARSIWRLETPYSVAAMPKAPAGQFDPQPGQPRPTAIICGNDVLAWGVLHALSREGIEVPARMTVTGIGDFNGSIDFEPSLTTVRIPARTIGEKGADAIVRLITSPGDANVGALVVPELFVRGTSDRCNSHPDRTS